MSLSSLATGIVSDRFGPTIATAGAASLTILWALAWAAWTWKLWRI